MKKLLIALCIIASMAYVAYAAATTLSTNVKTADIHYPVDSKVIEVDTANLDWDAVVNIHYNPIDDEYIVDYEGADQFDDGITDEIEFISILLPAEYFNSFACASTYYNCNKVKCFEEYQLEAFLESYGIKVTVYDNDFRMYEIVKI